MADYSDILNRSWDEIPEVTTLPNGSWRLKGRNVSYQPAKGDGNPSVLFIYQAKEPMDDVNDADLDALGEDYDYAANKLFHRVWLEADSDWDNVRKHLAKHGVDTTKHKSFKDAFDAFKGTEVVAYLGTRNYTDNAGEVKVDNTMTQFAVAE